MKKIITVLAIFFFDRITKMYLIYLQGGGTDVDFYIFSFLNIFLVWNQGIGFGLLSLESNIFYHILTLVIVIINIGLIVLTIKMQGNYGNFIALVLGGSMGNLFDRAYYYAVPDFIDFHLGNFHWFTFNIADIFITIGIFGLLVLEFLKKEKIKDNV